MLDFQIPRITSETVEENRGSFAIEPLDRGFGYTFGNSLRRVLLSSPCCKAVVAVVGDRDRLVQARHGRDATAGPNSSVREISSPDRRLRRCWARRRRRPARLR